MHHTLRGDLHKLFEAGEPVQKQEAVGFSQALKGNPYRNADGSFTSKDKAVSGGSLDTKEAPVLEGVRVDEKPKQTGTKIKASAVSFRSGTSDSGKEPENPSTRGGWMFESAPGTLSEHGKKGGSFTINDTFSKAKQKALQQAAAWGHNQLRIAP